MDVTFQRNMLSPTVLFSPPHLIALKMETLCSSDMMFTYITALCHNPNDHLQNIVMFCILYLAPCLLSNEPWCLEVDDKTFFVSFLYSFKNTHLVAL